MLINLIRQTSVLSALLLAIGVASASDRPIKIIVPWTAGGVTDTLVRAIANSMAQVGGQPVVVDNRPGASGAIGSVAVARSPADGYTLLASNADTHAINPLIFKKLPYDPIKNFEPVTLIARVPFALVTTVSKPTIKDVRSLVASARSDPGRITFSSWGVGSASHLGMELLTQSAGVQMHHIPYPSQTPGLAGVQGGHVDAMLLPAGGALAAAQSGTVNLLAVSSDQRLALMPGTPTLKESGTDLAIGNWFAFHAPAGTPQEVIKRLAHLTAEAMKDPKVVETYRLQAAVFDASGPDALRSFVVSEQKRWGEVVRNARISIDQ